MYSDTLNKNLRQHQVTFLKEISWSHNGKFSETPIWKFFTQSKARMSKYLDTVPWFVGYYTFPGIQMHPPIC